MLRLYPRVLHVALLAALSFSAACKEDDDDDDGHTHNTEDKLTGDCAAITDACHDVDEGNGTAHDCHELAHANDQAVCTPKKEECLAACEHHH